MRVLRPTLARGAAARTLCCVFTLLAGAAGAARAQDEGRLEAECVVFSDSSARRLCNATAQAIEIAHPRVGLAFAAGNPVAGTASTLGKRIGAVPRVSAGVRGNAVYLEIPPINRRDKIRLLIPAVTGDVAVGLVDGLTLAPTVGGFASLDLLGSIGIVPVSAAGFGSKPIGWGLGARLGLLRESFVTPGISVSGMYRRIGDITYGSPSLSVDSAFFRVSGYRDLSLRGAISKRLLVIGAALGVGWDRYDSDMEVRISDRDLLCINRAQACTQTLRVDGFTSDRFSAFADLSWTALVLSVVGEIGWQQGGDAARLAEPTGFEGLVGKGTFFGSLAFRLTL
ncbi:MAG: hypothetical protein IRZ00_07775 [Gemmatimonadetes bacterium]|nr:hypothetical protein [Gemmatimonadota bacterium]